MPKISRFIFKRAVNRQPGFRSRNSYRGLKANLCQAPVIFQRRFVFLRTKKKKTIAATCCFLYHFYEFSHFVVAGGEHHHRLKGGGPPPPQNNVHCTFGNVKTKKIVISRGTPALLYRLDPSRFVH